MSGHEFQQKSAKAIHRQIKRLVSKTTAVPLLQANPARCPRRDEFMAKMTRTANPFQSVAL